VNEIDLQRAFYRRTAPLYESQRSQDREHDLAAAWLESLLVHYGFESLLDVGAGTGKLLGRIHSRLPNVRLTGIEPVDALRNEAYERGIAPDVLVDGDAYALGFDERTFDIVTAFGVLHHVRDPTRVVAEMLRVARRAILISDTNNYGRGPQALRFAKVALRALHLWPLANYVYTAGRGYHVSDEDGIAYAYSVLDSFGQIRDACDEVSVLTLRGGMERPSPLVGASHIGLFGLKS